MLRSNSIPACNWRITAHDCGNSEADGGDVMSEAAEATENAFEAMVRVWVKYIHDGLSKRMKPNLPNKDYKALVKFANSVASQENILIPEDISSIARRYVERLAALEKTAGSA